jgi:hypothetical protein
MCARRLLEAPAGRGRDALARALLHRSALATRIAGKKDKHMVRKRMFGLVVLGVLGGAACGQADEGRPLDGESGAIVRPTAAGGRNEVVMIYATSSTWTRRCSDGLAGWYVGATARTSR